MQYPSEHTKNLYQIWNIHVYTYVPHKTLYLKWLTLYSIKRILTSLKYHVFENIMDIGAFAPLEQMLHFP